MAELTMQARFIGTNESGLVPKTRYDFVICDTTSGNIIVDLISHDGGRLVYPGFVAFLTDWDNMRVLLAHCQKPIP